MAQNTTADDGTADEQPVDDQYRPIYEFDEDRGAYGEVVCQIPREPQIEALRSIMGEGAVEPDGWVRGYNEELLPVIDGVPLVVFEQTRPKKVSSEGVETAQTYAIDDSLGQVKKYKAFAHPGNTSKIKVSEPTEEE